MARKGTSIVNRKGKFDISSAEVDVQLPLADRTDETNKTIIMPSIQKTLRKDNTQIFTKTPEFQMLRHSRQENEELNRQYRQKVKDSSRQKNALATSISPQAKLNDYGGSKRSRLNVKQNSQSQNMKGVLVHKTSPTKTGNPGSFDPKKLVSQLDKRLQNLGIQATSPKRSNRRNEHGAGKSPDYFIYSEDELLDSDEEDVKEGGSAEADDSADRRRSVDRNSTSSIIDGTPGRRKSNAETQAAHASGEIRPK